MAHPRLDGAHEGARLDRLGEITELSTEAQDDVVSAPCSQIYNGLDTCQIIPSVYYFQLCISNYSTSGLGAQVKTISCTAVTVSCPQVQYSSCTWKISKCNDIVWLPMHFKSNKKTPLCKLYYQRSNVENCSSLTFWFDLPLHYRGPVTLRIWISRRIQNWIRKYFRVRIIVPGGIVHWKKNQRSKISWYCPFKSIHTSLLSVSLNGAFSFPFWFKFERWLFISILFTS